MNVRRLLALSIASGIAISMLAGCDAGTKPLTRPAAPVVLTGSKLNRLGGWASDRVVAFRWASGAWQQIPVQVDQRKVVPYGSQPSSNTTPGTTGSVYGNGSGGPTSLQYADPNTWVGADANPKVDADDEVVFMASDAGVAAPAGTADPGGVAAGSGTRVEVADPRASAERGWVYLYRSTGSLDPSAGKDYVDYDFVLTSGDYKTKYKRADGPNAETSVVTTPAYSLSFTDRWKEVSWKVLAPGASQVDVLDGHKNQFAVSTCSRSNQTFADAEGAFVANIDGPVRAIRSYVGANSGPLTQRTHLMYRDRQDVITNLRVHPIPAIMDFVDFSAAAKGMKYRSSTKPNGVTIDGLPDAISTSLPAWEAVDGPQGRIYIRNTFTSSGTDLRAGTEQFHRDQTSPTEPQCWGDGSYFGAAGTYVKTGIPDTDPRSSSSVWVTGRRTSQFLAPAADPSKIAPYAADWAADIDAPLTTTVTPYPG
ncbi:hypothetical protein ACE2AJ_11760 [Aquihabitans daechungensis]|uniref:hypothetical protein n=1 Tax=Aquihabitans daechungensis TaxID=1052257 RepID=UPI003B9F2976